MVLEAASVSRPPAEDKAGIGFNASPIGLTDSLSDSRKEESLPPIPEKSSPIPPSDCLLVRLWRWKWFLWWWYEGWTGGMVGMRNNSPSSSLIIAVSWPPLFLLVILENLSSKAASSSVMGLEETEEMTHKRKEEMRHNRKNDRLWREEFILDMLKVILVMMTWYTMVTDWRGIDQYCNWKNCWWQVMSPLSPNDVND